MNTRKLVFFTLLLLVMTSSCLSGPNPEITTPASPELAETEIDDEETEIPDDGTAGVESEPTASPGEFNPYSEEIYYGVTRIRKEDTLNIRNGPGFLFDIIQSLQPEAKGLLATGNIQDANDSAWVELFFSENTRGWVNINFVTVQVSPEIACVDTKTQALLDTFAEAIQSGDADILSELVHPRRGISVRHNWWNPEVVYGLDEIPGLFSDPTSIIWGTEQGSGEVIEGSFADIIFPKLENVFNAEHSTVCNSLEPGVGTGPSAGLNLWPSEYSNINYFSFLRPAPEGDEFDWRSWAVGIEYVDGEPYLSIIVHYQWEI